MSDAARSPADDLNIEDTPVTVKLKVVPRVNTKALAMQAVSVSKPIMADEILTEPLKVMVCRVAPEVSVGESEPRKLTRTPQPTTVGPHLRVLRGQKPGVEYPIRAGENVIGRAADATVEVDIEGQESADRIWSSRRHAIIHLGECDAEIEDLQSLNGTFVNRLRVPSGERRPLKPNDIIQVGTIQFRFFA